MIRPTVGRVVLFHPPADHHWAGRTLAAIITAVHSDRLINVCAFGVTGIPFAFTSVPLHQPEDGPLSDIETQPFICHWMPYQLGQAGKTEELAAALATSAAVASAPGASPT